ncbi:MAG: autotransporter outer membrane beta-barrel domain-containing protein [Nitrospirae bacterium]|nr:autotransporter outer membrane beta-barrel domain-containing protein [Nitrospirota bacterium]
MAFFQNGKFISFYKGQPLRGNSNDGNSNDSNSNDSNSNDSNASRKSGQQGGLLIPFPSFSLDYDSYTYQSGTTDRKNDYLDFRAITLAKDSEYRLEYRYYRMTDAGSTDIKDQWVEARADFHFPDLKTNRTFDIYNRYSYHTTDGSSLTDLSSRGYWLRSFGIDQQDSLSITGLANYFATDTGKGYVGSASSSYTKRFSDRFTNTASVFFGYSKSNEDPNDFALQDSAGPLTAGIADFMQYQLSRIFSVTGSLSLGVQSKETDYSLSLGLNTNARVSTSTQYSYSHSGKVNEERDIHRIEFDARTMLTRNVFLVSRNYYQTSSSYNGEKENQLFLRGDIFWNFRPYRLQLTADYQSLKNFGSTVSDSKTVFQALLSRSFRNRLSLLARVSYAKFNSGLSTLEFEPSVSWAFRRVSVVAKYTMRKTEQSAGNSIIDHRFYFALRRDFDTPLRPLFR